MILLDAGVDACTPPWAWSTVVARSVVLHNERVALHNEFVLGGTCFILRCTMDLLHCTPWYDIRAMHDTAVVVLCHWCHGGMTRASWCDTCTHRAMTRCVTYAKGVPPLSCLKARCKGRAKSAEGHSTEIYFSFLDTKHKRLKLNQKNFLLRIPGICKRVTCRYNTTATGTSTSKDRFSAVFGVETS